MVAFFKKLGKEKPQDLWQQYLNKHDKPSDEALIKNAKIVAPLVIEQATALIKGLFSLCQQLDMQIDDSTYETLFLETVVFILFTIDRTAYNLLLTEDFGKTLQLMTTELVEKAIGPTRSKDEVLLLVNGEPVADVKEAAGKLVKLWYEKRVAKRNVFMDTLLSEVFQRVSKVCKYEKDAIGSLYNTRIVEYSKYEKILPEEDESPRGTLLWEFGEKIAALSGNPLDIAVVLYVQQAVALFLVNLPLRKFMHK